MSQVKITYKKKGLQLLQLASFIFFLFGCSAQNQSKFDAIRHIASFKNAILMIGDGMGHNHIKVTEAFNEQTTFISRESEVTGWVTTRSSSSNVTDSAAAATAMSTGMKVANGSISVKSGFHLTTMSEFAKANGKGVGIIATESLTGATPAAFSSHNSKRSNTDQIASEQFLNTVDLYMGAGKTYYDSKKDDMSNGRLSYYTNFNSLSEDIENSDSQYPFSRFLASFDTISVSESTATSPTLADMSLKAIAYLNDAYADSGFFLMIEGSHIDKRAHDNDLNGMINQVNGFDQAVEAVVEWAHDANDTFVMVTADHETGGLQYDGETKSELNDDLFTTGGHTGVNVPFYVYTDDKYPFFEQDEIIDNTDIAKFYRGLMRKS